MAALKNGAAMPRHTHPVEAGPRGQLAWDLARYHAASVGFDEARAYIIFAEIARRYRGGVGFYHGVRQVQPQHLYTPQELKEKGGRELANFFFFLAMSQRGGLNSDDSIRVTNAVWRVHPRLFEPTYAASLSGSQIRHAIQEVAERFYAKGLNGDRNRRAGSLSFKLHEFADHWQRNARVLLEFWASDVRQVFQEERTFEQYFQLIDRGSNWTRRAKEKENPRGFYGMRRKIFALLAFWLIEFELVREFRIPLVVDFHVMRALLELGILRVTWKKLGPGKPKIKARTRPEPLWDYESVNVHEKIVNQIVAWSYEFLGRHNLSPFDVHNGLWNLSRVLCAAYYGNSCTTLRRADESEKIHTLTERLVDPKKLEEGRASWPKGYRDLCKLCPFEEHCCIAIPSGPYYDWGMMVRAGHHVVYPAREAPLSGVAWFDLPVMIMRRRNNIPADLTPSGSEDKLEEPESEQLVFE